MNANIFSCIVPPLLVLETQIIHPEPLQSFYINQCIPLVAIFFADVCVQMEARIRLRVGAPVCTCPPPLCVQCGSKFDTLASLKLSKVFKKKLVKFFLCTNVWLKRTDGRTSMSIHPRPKPTSEPPCLSS